MKQIISMLLAVGAYVPVVYAKTINCPTCSQSDFENAVYAQAAAGDTIVLPTGSATWGNSARFNKGVIYITTPGITIEGQGDSTVITLDDTGSTYSSGGVIAFWSNGVFKNIKIIASSVNPVTAFSVYPYGSFTGGFRITNITYIGGAGSSPGYFAYVAPGVNSGLIDNCRITGNSGSAELIFGRGPTNAWQSTNTLGGADNIFIEDCTFNNIGYVCDANSNACFVVRYNTIAGPIKVDGHGVASNTPPRSFRNMEVYGNHWTNLSAAWTAIEIRGGTSRVFDNISDNTLSAAWFYFCDYGYLSAWPNFGSVFQTPVNYPIADQVGVGKDPKVAASEPAYAWNNLKNGSSWPRSFHTVAAGAISLYQSQTGNPAATFTESTMIQSNRDFYADAGFDTNTGVSRGTTAQMNALTPGIAGYGFWVTDQGNWKSGAPGTSGQLYVWNGSAWILNYTPYLYPHPMRRPSAPTGLRVIGN